MSHVYNLKEKFILERNSMNLSFCLICTSLMGGEVRNIRRIWSERLWKALLFVLNFSLTNYESYLLIYYAKHLYLNSVYKLNHNFVYRINIFVSLAQLVGILHFIGRGRCSNPGHPTSSQLNCVSSNQ